LATVATKWFNGFELIASSSPTKNEWTIDVAKGNGLVVASASFAGVYEYGLDEDHPNRSTLVGLKGWEVMVDPDYRRKGLASAMYQFAEEVFELPIAKGDFQTPMGKSFLHGRK